MPIHSEFADIFMVSEADRHPLRQILIVRAEETEGEEKGTNVFMDSEVDRSPLTQSPEHSDRRE